MVIYCKVRYAATMVKSYTCKSMLLQLTVDSTRCAIEQHLFLWVSSEGPFNVACCDIIEVKDAHAQEKTQVAPHAGNQVAKCKQQHLLLNSVSSLTLKDNYILIITFRRNTLYFLLL